jgi:Flp pilus assembly protein TadG
MRRLTWHLAPVRMGEEKGAAAVFVALFMTMLVGCAAIAIDVSSAYSDRHQLQNGADAAAIAVALDCARDLCGNSTSTATAAVQSNTTAADAADATIGTPTVTTTGRTTKVTARATSNHFFGQVLGRASHEVTASSSASWIPTTRGRAIFPLIISHCEYVEQIKRRPLGNTTKQRINAATPQGQTCDGPSGQTLSGYAVSAPDSSAVCRTTSTVGDDVLWYTGQYSYGLPPSCSTSYLASIRGTTILIPVWDKVTGSGSNARFHVYGYAAFHLLDYDIYNSDPALIGYFTFGAQQSDATTASTSTAPDLGARSVFLSKG